MEGRKRMGLGAARHCRRRSDGAGKSQLLPCHSVCRGDDGCQNDGHETAVFMHPAAIYLTRVEGRILPVLPWLDRDSPPMVCQV